MNNLLFISKNQGMFDAIRACLPLNQITCHLFDSIISCHQLLSNHFFSICILHDQTLNNETIRKIEGIKNINSKIPIFLVIDFFDFEWEEEAFLKGVNYILKSPIRAPLLNCYLQKVLDFSSRGSQTQSVISCASDVNELSKHEILSSYNKFDQKDTLGILRDFSRIFSFSFDLKSFTYQFALKLREIIGVNKIAIFIEPGRCLPVAFGEPSRNIQCLCSVGIEPELFNYFTLSTQSGIARNVLKTGRILKFQTPFSDSSSDSEIQKEFEILGGQIAIPILDRERTIGVAVLGDRLTGLPFTNEEIQLLFHLMEELGMAIKNNLLHDQLVSHHKLISGVFSQMKSGCLIIDSDLNILHANPSFLDFFQLADPVQFSKIPKKISSLLYESAHLGKFHDPFFITPDHLPQNRLLVSIIPYRDGDRHAGAMLFVEDHTLLEAAKAAELQASNLKVISVIAEKFAHEIRNALVPIKTYAQLLPERHDNPEFRKTLEETLLQETRRIGRLTDQLLYLSKQEISLNDTESLATLLQDAFDQARKLVTGTAEIECSPQISQCHVQCDSSSLKHAFFEVLLNGLQSNPEQPKVRVSGTIDHDSQGRHMLTMRFQDQGKGIPSDVSDKAADPFFTTRNVGVGLGLSVSRKIVEAHQGKLEIEAGNATSRGGIAISLPVSSPIDSP